MGITPTAVRARKQEVAMGTTPRAMHMQRWGTPMGITPRAMCVRKWRRRCESSGLGKREAESWCGGAVKWRGRTEQAWKGRGTVGL
jgi:hypothetical protein